jgi:EpsI family protein
MEKINTIKLLIIIIILVVLTGFTYTIRYRATEMPNLPDLELVPRNIDGYSSTTNQLSPGAIKVLGVDTTLARDYSNGKGQKIEFFLGFFLTQQKHSQIHSPKHCYPGSGWDILKESRITFNPGGNRISARTILISNKKEKRLVVYWFYINSKIITNEFALKWEQMKCSLQGKTQPATFIRFSVIMPQGREKETKSNFLEFIELIQPYIDLALKQTV